MSFEAVDKAFEQECRDGLAKMVLIAIARHADKKHQAFPSAERIAKLSNISRRTVQRKIKELQQDGLIVVKNRGKDAKKTSNLYVLSYMTHSRLDTTDSPPNGVTQSHRISQDNKSTNLSFNTTDSRNQENETNEIDWAAMAAEAMKGK